MAMHVHVASSAPPCATANIQLLRTATARFGGFGPKLTHVVKAYADGQVAWVGDKHTQRFIADLGLVTLHGMVRVQTLLLPRQSIVTTRLT